MKRDIEFYENIHRQYNEKTDEQLYDMLIKYHKEFNTIECSKISIELYFREYMKFTPGTKDVNYYIGGMQYWYNSTKQSLSEMTNMRKQISDIEEENDKLHIFNFIWKSIGILFSILLCIFLFCTFFK